jgi:hypothetical protein
MTHTRGKPGGFHRSFVAREKGFLGDAYRLKKTIKIPSAVKMSQKPSLAQLLQSVQLVLTGNTRRVEKLRPPRCFTWSQ